MKDWKDKLRDIKRTLRGASTSENRGDKPERVDFKPPESWLSTNPREDRPMPKPIDASAGTPPSYNSARTPSTRSNSTTPRPSISLPPPHLHQPWRALVDGKPGCPPVGQMPSAPEPAFRPSIDASRALAMPDWATIGKALQHPRGHGGRDLTARVGIDFGTAFTKVAIRVGREIVVVDWSKVTSDDSQVGRWIMPNFVYRGRGDVFGWRYHEGGEWQGNLKLPLIEGEGRPDCPTATLAFLALVIRYTRAFLYASKRQMVEDRSIRWELNFGCPTEPHEKPQIVERFQHVARTAWWLAGREDLDEAAIRVAWDRSDFDTGLETEPGIIPEFIAQISAYLRSPQVNDGLHALVDVGAATLDVATFNIVRPRDESTPRIPIFFSAVKPLGTHFLAHRRHVGLGLELLWDDSAPVETATSFARRHGRDGAEIERIDSEYAREVSRCIANVMNSTRTNTRGDPSSAAWHEGLPVFVTGGGAVCDVYQRALRESEAEVKVGIGPTTGFRFIEMDLARAELSVVAPIATNRLTVAIGLTEDAEDIARIVPHRDIEPLTNPGSEPRPDRDELYAK